MSLVPQVNARRLRTQQSFSSSTSIPTTENSSAEQSIITIQDTVTVPTTAKTSTTNTTATVVSQKYGIHAAANRNKQAMQKLANTFVELNKRKAEKRDHGQSTWRNLIKGVLDLQRGKIPLLLAVEAGNQSMCRELLSAQTAEQLKVQTGNESATKKTQFSIQFAKFDLIHFIAGNY